MKDDSLREVGVRTTFGWCRALQNCNLQSDNHMYTIIYICLLGLEMGKHAPWLVGLVRVTANAEMRVDRFYCVRQRTEGGVAESNWP